MPETAAPSPAVFLDSLPPWASDLVRAVTAKQSNAFVLHGVPADLIPVRGPAGLRFLSLDHFLVHQLFAGWSSLATYNRAQGLGFAPPASPLPRTSWCGSSSPVGPRSSPTPAPRGWVSPRRRRAATSRTGCAPTTPSTAPTGPTPSRATPPTASRSSTPTSACAPRRSRA